METEAGVVISQERKEVEIHRHFVEHLGTNKPRDLALNWDNLGYQPAYLCELEEPFTEHEIQETIKSMPAWFFLQEMLEHYKGGPNSCD